MARRKVKRLPVVNDEGLLEGVVSCADLLKVFLRDDEDLAEEVRREVVERLFPATADHAPPVATSVESMTPSHRRASAARHRRARLASRPSCSSDDKPESVHVEQPGRPPTQRPESIVSTTQNKAGRAQVNHC
jgi:hypothetical protein